MPFSTMHATTTVLLIGLLWYPYAPPVLILYIAVASGVFLDLDILLVRPHHRHGHRDLITHSMLPWLLLLLTSIWIPITLWIAIPILLHLSLDAIDGGIMPLAPLSKWRIRAVEVSDDIDYVSRYWRDDWTTFFELLFSAGAVIISLTWSGELMLSIVNWCSWASISVVIVLSLLFRLR